MSIFYTSDIHFGHENIIKYCNRPFSSVDEMNQVIIERWNSVVTDEDWVYVLGDVALGKIKDSLPLVGLLNGHKALVPGNHDRCWLGHKKVGDKEIHMYLDAGFEEIHHKASTVIDGRTVEMCHFPYEGDSHEVDRYVDHRPKRNHKSDFLLHGHVHDAWQIKDRQINVGMDVWGFVPVPYETISAIVKKIGYGDGSYSPRPPIITTGI